MCTSIFLAQCLLPIGRLALELSNHELLKQCRVCLCKKWEAKYGVQSIIADQNDIYEKKDACYVLFMHFVLFAYTKHKCLPSKKNKVFNSPAFGNFI